MLEAIISALQSPKPKLKQKLKPSRKDENINKRKAPSSLISDQSSKSSRSSSMSLPDNTPMDCEQSSITPHYTRNSLVSHASIYDSDKPFTHTNRSPMFIRHSGEFALSPPRRNGGYHYSDRYRELKFHQLAKANSNAANLTTFISNADHPNAHTQTSTSSATLSTASTRSAQIEPAATQLSAPLLLTYCPPVPKVSEALQKDNST